VSGGGDKPGESLTLNFTKIEFKYDPSHKAPDTVTWDLAQGKLVQ